MADLTNDTAGIRRLLAARRRIAVVGASPDPARDSHQIFQYLLEHGHDAVPVNPRVGEITGHRCYPDLQATAEHWGQPPEIVDVFRAPEHLPDIIDQAIAVGAYLVWCQFGVVDPQANKKALEAGLDIVVDRCIKVEHGRLVAQPS